MVGFDETLNQLNEVIKNKQKEEDEEQMLRFSPGPTLEKIINNNKEKVGKFIWKRPDFGKVTTELGNESPQDFHIGGEDVLKAYPLGELNQYDTKIGIYLQDKLIRVFGIDKNEGSVYEMGIIVRGNKSSGYHLGAQYLIMTPASNDSDVRIVIIYEMLYALDKTLKMMGLTSGIADINFNEGDFAPGKRDKELYPGKINLAGITIHHITSYVKWHSGKG